MTMTIMRSDLFTADSWTFDSPKAWEPKAVAQVLDALRRRAGVVRCSARTGRQRRGSTGVEAAPFSGYGSKIHAHQAW